MAKCKDNDSPISEIHGQSKGATPWKEVGIRDALELSVRLSFGPNRSLAHFPFWYVDLNAGSGVNEKVGCDGSPIEFLKVMHANNRFYYALFCDKEKESIRQLKKRIKRMGHPQGANRIFCDPCNNAHFLRIVNNYIRSKEKPALALGAVLADPNGTSSTAFPLQQLAEFMSEYRKMDLIVNWNIAAAKRCRGVTESGNRSWKSCDKWRESCAKGTATKRISEIMDIIPKNHWLIREPVGNRNRYVMLIGRTAKVKPNERLRFYDVDSKRGREIVDYADK